MRAPLSLVGGLALVALSLALALYYPTLRLSFAYDDIDAINLGAEALAGKRGFWATVFHPHAEHLIPGFRLLLFASLELFGTSALPLRLLILLAHATSAVLAGLLARHYATAAGAPAPAAAAGLAATTLYVGAAGLSSMCIWFPLAAVMSLAMTPWIGAALALAHRRQLGARRARSIAFVLTAVALLTESALAPMVMLPVAVEEHERRRAGASRWSLGAFSIGCLSAAGAVAAAATLLYSRTYGPQLSVSLLHGAPRAAFLVLTASFRLLFPGIPILASDPGRKTALLGALLGMAVAAPLAALLLALWRRGTPSTARIAGLAALGPLGCVMLAGLGRWRSTFWEIYDADRYFHPLLLPLALLAGAAAASAVARLAAWPGRVRHALAALLLVGLGSELVLHRRAMLGRIPFGVYAAHEERLAQLARLARRLETAAAARPSGAPALEVPHTAIWFPEVHNGHLRTSVLVRVLADDADRLRLGGASVSRRDAASLNPILEAWAREIGVPLPYLSIDAAGRLSDAHTLRLADFRAGPHEGAVVSGFFPWEGAYRWMGARGELRLVLTSPRLVLTLSAPLAELRAAGIDGITIEVSAVDEATAWRAPLGTLRIAAPGTQVYRLDATPFLGRLGAGRTAHLVLDADRTWKPSQVLGGSADTRDLSVMVLAAGCE